MAPKWYNDAQRAAYDAGWLTASQNKRSTENPHKEFNGVNELELAWSMAFNDWHEDNNILTCRW